MSFLKSEPFTYNGNTIQLFELSALQRIEYLQYLADEEKHRPVDAGESETVQFLVASNIRTSARLVAMALWHVDTTREINELHHEVLSGWPPDMIGSAMLFVKTLSDMMLPPAEASVDEGDDESDAETISAEKP